MWLLINAANQWLRTHLAWSNSRQSWIERLSVLILLIGAAALIWWPPRTLEGTFALWVVLLVGAAFMLRRGWLKLFGPVLFYDMVRVGRRSRYILFRALYVSALLLLLWYVYLISELRDDHGGAGTIQRMAEFAQSLFYTFMTVQLVLAAVMTPGYVAGAIAEEKDRQTLEYLLATDLRNREIVLSKLVARLASLLLIVLAGLPVLSFMQFFGGVDPELLLAGFAATGLIMASLAGVSILCSVHAKKPRDAIIVTYLIVVAYHGLSFVSLILLNRTMADLVLGLVLGGLVGAAPYVLPVDAFNVELLAGALMELANSGFEPLKAALDVLNSGNLLLALYELDEAMDAAQPLHDALADVLGRFALFHGTIAVLCSAWAVVRLRRVALKEAAGKAVAQTLTARLFGRPAVGAQPMLWKEIFAEPGLRFNWMGRIAVLFLVFLSFVPVLFIAAAVFEHFGSYRTQREDLAQAMNIYVFVVGTLVGSLLLLAVAVRAAGALAGERDQQTIDGLLTTPLDSGQILFAKWAGSVLSVRWAWAWLGTIWWLGLATGGLQPGALPLLVGAWLVYAGVFAVVGLWFSLVSRTTLRATLWTLLTTLTLAVGHWVVSSMCCFVPLAMMTISSNRDVEYVMKFQFGQTPPLVLGLFAFAGQEHHFTREWEEVLELVGFSVLGLGTWAVGGLALGALLHHRFQEMTLRGDARYPEGGRATTMNWPAAEIPRTEPCEATDDRIHRSAEPDGQ